MDELPEKQRLVLLLSAIEGPTLEEVAALLKIPWAPLNPDYFLFASN